MNKDFSAKDKRKMLLWCDRHCCLCKKAAGVDIEIHHIIPKGRKGSRKIDNGIPLCYDCHGKVQRYNEDYPMGSKYRPEELKIRREQVYEEFTRHLVPPVHWLVTQSLPDGRKRQLPDVGFILKHLGDSLPVKVFVKLEIKQGKKSLVPFRSGHYSGKRAWNLNPRHQTKGRFRLPIKKVNIRKKFEVIVNVEIQDQYERRHKLLPVGFVYMIRYNDWYFNP